MNPDRWQQIDRLLDEALDRKPEERPAFLEQACAADPELRTEVEALLEAHDKAGSFVQKPALDPAAAPPSHHPAASLVGRRLGPYEVLSPIGRGGMGEVYHARDTRLGRSVALKILPPEFVTDEERMRRFRREAKAASALNHANVATIYDVGESEGTHYIAMEYVEGKTLDELIGRKGMRLGDALNYGVQIADALATAHEAGIVHRDLKPGNVMGTSKGQVKVLDFGLAKWKEKVSFSGEDSEATGQATTEEGRIVGTVTYMSPEQAEGRTVDARSDIFSFGSVLYEMVTGRRAFEGDSNLATLSAILHQEPKPARTITHSIPADLEKLIHRCLRKDPAKRFQHMDDVKVALEELKEDSGKFAGDASLQKGRRTSVWISAALAVGVALALVVWFWLERSRPGAEESVLTPVPLTTYPGTETYPSFSPDGTQVAFQWCPEGWAPGKNCDIYVKQIGMEPPSPLTNTPEQEYGPTWSPDGRFIAFLRQYSAKKEALVVIPQRGGPQRVLAEMAVSKPSTLLDGPYLAWTPDSKWVATPAPEAGGGRWNVCLFSVETGEKLQLTNATAETESGSDTAPAISPNGRILAFARIGAAASSLCLLRLGEGYKPQGKPESIPTDNPYNIGAAWTPDGSDIVFSSGVRLATRVSTNHGLWRMTAAEPAKGRRLPFAQDGARSPAISRLGNRLAYALDRSDWNIWRIDLQGPDRKPGVPFKLISSTRSESGPGLSPDGKRIVFQSDRSGVNELWVCDSDGSNPAQLTTFGGTARDLSLGEWSPDGKSIVFDANVGGNFGVHVISVGGGVPRRLTVDPRCVNFPFWSQDGQSIYFRSGRGGTSQVWKMPAGGGDAIQISHDPEGVGRLHKSPDGRFVYYSKGWPNPASVWRVPVEGGEAAKVLDGVHSTAQFAIAENGIYFFAAPYGKGYSDLSLCEFATARTRKILTIERPVTWFIAASRDGRTILYTQIDESGSDLMLVENFR